MHETGTVPTANGSGNRERWVVQKFGGTSLGKYAAQIARDIVKSSLAASRVAVICSARSSNTKAKGTTNLLLRAAREAEGHATESHREIVAAIHAEHTGAASELVKDAGLAADVIKAIDGECKALLTTLDAADLLGEVSRRTEDKIIRRGERLSCLLITAVLCDAGVDAQYVDLSDALTVESTATLDRKFYADLVVKIKQLVRDCGDRVPVITGYFGNVPGGLLKSVGRGYTDLCAALVAVALEADELQIWKEVDGIFTADPGKVPTARLLPSVSPSEAAELTFYGSEVIHPFTMEQAMNARIPIRIKNVTNIAGDGTVIVPEPVKDTHLARRRNGPRLLRSRSASTPTADVQTPKRPTAVTVKHKIVVLNIHSNKRTRAHGFLMNIFRTLDDWHLCVDLVSSSEVHVSMALHSESKFLIDADEVQIQNADLRGAVMDLGNYGTVDLVPDMAIISVVGRQLSNMFGISGKIFSTLGHNGINIQMISQGASEINVSCVIAEDQADRALSLLHTNLFTFLD